MSVIDEDGRALVDLADAPRPSGELEVPVRLLPKFDSLKLAYAPANRGRTLPKPYYDDVIKTANGQVLATVLVDGLVAGTWAVHTTKRAVEITVTQLDRWGRGVRGAVRDEAERIGGFLNDADVAMSPSASASPDAGSHLSRTGWTGSGRSPR